MTKTGIHISLIVNFEEVVCFSSLICKALTFKIIEMWERFCALIESC